MALELECRIVRKLPVQNGTSARGPWAKQEFVVEYKDGQFPNQVCMNVWGADKVRDLERFQIGDNVRISFNLNSREFNGRWYNDVRAWKIESAGATQAAAQPQQSYGYSAQPAPAPAAPAPSIDDMPDDSGEDLPF